MSTLAGRLLERIISLIQRLVLLLGRLGEAVAEMARRDPRTFVLVLTLMVATPIAMLIPPIDLLTFLFLILLFLLLRRAVRWLVWILSGLFT